MLREIVFLICRLDELVNVFSFDRCIPFAASFVFAFPPHKLDVVLFVLHPINLLAANWIHFDTHHISTLDVLSDFEPFLFGVVGQYSLFIGCYFFIGIVNHWNKTDENVLFDFELRID